MNRRELLTTFLATAAIGGNAAEVQAQQREGRQLKALSFAPDGLDGISERVITSHHQNNYSGAFRKLAAVESDLASLPSDAPAFLRKGLKMEELTATNAVILHEEYFQSLGGDGRPDGSVAEAIGRDFGSVSAWETEFRAISATLGGGSGWATLSFNFNDGRLHNYIAFDHTDNIPFGRPVLVNDMFEHAYHMDYGTRAGEYIDAFMRNVNWDECNRRYEAAENASQTLRA